MIIKFWWGLIDRRCKSIDAVCVWNTVVLLHLTHHQPTLCHIDIITRVFYASIRSLKQERKLKKRKEKSNEHQISRNNKFSLFIGVGWCIFETHGKYYNVVHTHTDHSLVLKMTGFFTIVVVVVPSNVSLNAFHTANGASFVARYRRRRKRCIAKWYIWKQTHFYGPIILLLYISCGRAHTHGAIKQKR